MNIYQLVRKIWHWTKAKYYNVILKHYPYLWSKVLYKRELGKTTNFNNPKDINEKIQWLEFFSDTDLWSLLADKYRVRKYVANVIEDDILVPMIGMWENVDDINFDELPDKFVIKPNNGSYDSFIVDDKSTADLSKIKASLAISIKKPFGLQTAEPHYTRIKPCIIAEELLETNNPHGLVDYKIWCFNGEAAFVFVAFNRDKVTHHAQFACYDLKWNKHPEYMTSEFVSDGDCERPENLDKMIEYAKILSKGLPQARIDFYNIDGRIYFGEITLTSNYGMMPYFTQSALDRMGSMCELPKVSARTALKTAVNRWFPKI